MVALFLPQWKERERGYFPVGVTAGVRGSNRYFFSNYFAIFFVSFTRSLHLVLTSHLLSHSCILTTSLTHSLTHSPTHSLNHSLIHSPTHSLTHTASHKPIFGYTLIYEGLISVFCLFLGVQSNSMRGFVRPSVRPSMRPSVTRFFYIAKTSKISVNSRKFL